MLTRLNQVMKLYDTNRPTICQRTQVGRAGSVSSGGVLAAVVRLIFALLRLRRDHFKNVLLTPLQQPAFPRHDHAVQ